MTLEEAIKYCEEVAELNEECARIYNEQGKTMESYSCKECASEHRQLAEWLRELKAYREAEEEINRKMKSGQWSDAVVYGMSKASVIIEKCRFAHNCKGVNADDSN